MKVKSSFFCSNCGSESPKWIGKCPSCGEWNTYHEEIIEKQVSSAEKEKVWKKATKEKPIPKKLEEVSPLSTLRLDTQDQELNRVLGGGLVAGSIILVGGQPGIGKSTLLLQLALRLNKKSLYVSGEESEEQIKMRADRVGCSNPSCYIYTEVNVSKILKEAALLEPDLVIIDSVQTLVSPFIDSAPGSISQIRECTAELQRFAKETNIPVFIIGHITKEGGIAGPKLLEHIVDVVLQFEGDQHYAYRILRTLKNRFGSTDEIGIYAMDAQGLQEIANPSELLVSPDDYHLSGSAVAASLEGLRPLLIETQALVSPAVYGTPQRSATGFDLRRLAMLLAVLEKRCGLAFGNQDVFLNIAGGIRVSDPSIDLAVVTALISSLQDIHVSKKMCFAGEVGLAGEIRPVSRIEQRIQEAGRLGFETIYVAKQKSGGIESKKFGIEVRTLTKVEDLLREIFG
ncbi:MAG: DNA repair protein RadA [Chitinophagales bacterium]|nr:DNA repair protein RadA [Chitinophagales bacterium]